jgi:hypothetical protein
VVHNGNGCRSDRLLGHAGVVAIDECSGDARYFEYGRYDTNFGQVKERDIPNVVIGGDGKPTGSSLKFLYNYLSKNWGKDSPILPRYYEDADYQKIIDFALARMNDKNRLPYSWSPSSPNQCKTFAQEAIDASR